MYFLRYFMFLSFEFESEILSQLLIQILTPDLSFAFLNEKYQQSQVSQS